MNIWVSFLILPHSAACYFVSNILLLHNKTSLAAAFCFVADIYIFAIGTDILDTELMSLTAGNDGRHYFRMKDITNLNETFDEIIGKKSFKI